jgi:hypothetical protein
MALGVGLFLPIIVKIEHNIFWQFLVAQFLKNCLDGGEILVSHNISILAVIEIHRAW